MTILYFCLWKDTNTLNPYICRKFYEFKFYLGTKYTETKIKSRLSNYDSYLVLFLLRLTHKDEQTHQHHIPKDGLCAGLCDRSLKDHWQYQPNLFRRKTLMSEWKDTEIKTWLFTVKGGTSVSVFDSTRGGQTQEPVPSIWNIKHCSSAIIAQLDLGGERHWSTTGWASQFFFPCNEKQIWIWSHSQEFQTFTILTNKTLIHHLSTIRNDRYFSGKQELLLQTHVL